MQNSEPITIHMIGHSHIDPVWLWQWQDGMDEVLATFRTAATLMERHPEFIFSHGEAWAYQQVEMLDPELFERIQGYVKQGRWEIVGGWWMQPDCNLPTDTGFQRQIQAGKDYFQSRFGLFPDIAVNVDSFGHSAALPGLIHEAGQSCYVMMRPQEHEKHLPARMFRWRGFEDSPEVTTFRISGGYGTFDETIHLDHVERSLVDLPEGIRHTMCFYGVGDHGGGPTEGSIQWILANRDAISGCVIEFSSMSRFFKAIEADKQRLPVVTGELQYHAIGCYTVDRQIKMLVRQAEQALRQAEIMLEIVPDAKMGKKLTKAWQRVAFNQFHDVLAGSCIPSAYKQCYAQLGYALTIAAEVSAHSLRRMTIKLPSEPMQRMVLCNASDRPFTGYTEFEPWSQFRQWQPSWKLLNDRDEEVPYQMVKPEAVTNGNNRLVIHADLAPKQMMVYRIDRGSEHSPQPERPAAEPTTLSNSQGVGVDLQKRQFTLPAGGTIALPHFELITDTSDTWSHGIDRYAGEITATDTWEEPQVLLDGPMMQAIWQQGHVGQSKLQAEWRVYDMEMCVELRLRVHWQEKQKMLKLCLPLPVASEVRIDGIPGASLERPNDGREYPLMGWSLLQSTGTKLGVVCPLVLALDASPEVARFSLLRSSLMAHHDPGKADRLNAVISDQGVHDISFRFHFGDAVSVEMLEAESIQMQRPPLIASVTLGMPVIPR
ncbi:MAG: glycoside hydrolase family 38 N-terminal domain-containing protein [Armatimonadota bacterium]